MLLCHLYNSRNEATPEPVTGMVPMCPINCYVVV